MSLLRLLATAQDAVSRPTRWLRRLRHRWAGVIARMGWPRRGGIAVVGDAVGASARPGTARRECPRIVCRGREGVPGREMPHAYAAHATEPWQSRGRRPDARSPGAVGAAFVREDKPRMAGSPGPRSPGASRDMVILVVLRDTGRGDIARRLASSENRCSQAGGGRGTGSRPSYT